MAEIPDQTITTTWDLIISEKLPLAPPRVIQMGNIADLSKEMYKEYEKRIVIAVYHNEIFAGYVSYGKKSAVNPAWRQYIKTCKYSVQHDTLSFTFG